MFRELIDQFSVTANQDAYTITKKIIDTSEFPEDTCGTEGSIAALPEIGDDFDGDLHGAFADTTYDFTLLHLVSITAQPFEWRSHNIICYVLEYGVQPAEDNRETQSLTLGVEVLTLDNDGTGSGTKFQASGDQFPAYFSKYIPIADYTFSAVFDNFEASYTFEGIGKLSDFIGKVNNTLGGDGHWLCASIEVQQIVTREGYIKYRRTEHYKYRKISGDNVDIPSTGNIGGWNAVYNPKKAKFEWTTPLVYDLSTTWIRAMPNI